MKKNKNKSLNEALKPGEPFKVAGFDDDTLTIKNSVLVGSESANGYAFSDKALNDLVGLLEGAKCFLDHDMNLGPGEIRKFEDLYARVSNVRFDDQTRKVMGDIQLPPTKEVMENVFPKLKFFKNDVGNSIDALGSSEFMDEGEIVTDVFALNSLDMVTNPATTKDIFESNRSKKSNEEVEPMDPKELKSKHPDVYEKVLAEGKAIALKESKQGDDIKVLTEQVTTLKTENSDLATKLDDAELKLKAQEDDKAVAKLLKESKLPEDAITDTFVANLKKCETEEDRKALIDDRKNLLESNGAVINPGKDVNNDTGNNSGVPSVDDVFNAL